MIFKKKISDRRYKNDTVDTPLFKMLPYENWNVRRKAYSCPCCNTVRTMEEYPRNNGANPILYLVDSEGNKRSFFCVHCLNKMFEDLTKRFGDKFKAMYVLCFFTGFYYNDDIAHKIFAEAHLYDDGSTMSKTIPPMNLYFRAIQENDAYSCKEFFDNDSVPFSYIVGKQRGEAVDDKMTDQGRRDRNEIVEKFHYDPFDKEPAVDRNRLYSDLLTLSDDAMATDLVRQRAAIEIVKSFYRIDCIGQTIQELQSDTESMVKNSKVLKELIDQKKKETDMVTAFSKDHGFAERYQMAKTKGAGTLSSIVRDGFENHFDKLAVNKFDIETSNAMKQVAEISVQSMLNQVQFTSDDFRTMMEDQTHEIQNLRAKVEELEEKNRILREKHIKQELLDEYYEDLVKKGIEDKEVIDAALKNASSETFYSKDGDSE